MKHFKKFLENLDVLEEYKRNLIALNKKKNILETMLGANTNYIVFAFLWEKTPEGVMYWNLVNDLWGHYADGAASDLAKEIRSSPSSYSLTKSMRKTMSKEQIVNYFFA
jgi:hypothetical protein